MKHDELYYQHQVHNRRFLRAWFGGCLLGLLVALVVAWMIPGSFGPGGDALFGAVSAMAGGGLACWRLEP